MSAVAFQLERAYPKTNRKLGAAVVPLREDLVGDTRTTFVVLLVAAGAVLFIACANVANLLLIRGAERQRELAVRAAVGASRVQLIRQLAIESLILSGAGALVGLFLATLGMTVLQVLIPAKLVNASPLSLNVPVLCFALGVSLLSGVLFGLLPALQSSRLDLNTVLKQGGRTSSKASGHFRQIFVIAQVSMALVLLAAAGLMVQTLVNADALVGTFTNKFQVDARFPDWPRLMKRFTEAISSVFNQGFSKLPAVEEAHNELCVAAALLDSLEPRFSQLDYEPSLNGCAQSIDFRARGAAGLTVYVDVKTIQPKSTDRWDQFEKAQQQKWFPPNIYVRLTKEGLGGKLWHSQFTARSRMLEYTCEFEEKIAQAALAGRDNTFFVMTFCGSDFHWHESGLEDFVAFYRTGQHRADDPLGPMEAHNMEQKQIRLTGSITRFACLLRPQLSLNYSRLNWNVRPPRYLEPLSKV